MKELDSPLGGTVGQHSHGIQYIKKYW
jgi:hypothetical protein